MCSWHTLICSTSPESLYQTGSLRSPHLTSCCYRERAHGSKISCWFANCSQLGRLRQPCTRLDSGSSQWVIVRCSWCARRSGDRRRSHVVGRTHWSLYLFLFLCRSRACSLAWVIWSIDLWPSSARRLRAFLIPQVVPKSLFASPSSRQQHHQKLCPY